MLNRIISHTAFSALALTCLAGLAAPNASAQISFSSSVVRTGDDGPGPTVSEAALKRYSKLLKLDGAQSEAIATLHAAYREVVKAAKDEMNQSMKSGREAAKDGDFEAMGKKIREATEKSSKKQNVATEEFLRDLKSTLTPGQSEIWPRIERMRRREGMGGTSMVSGGAVDLFNLVEGVAPSAENLAKIELVLIEYENDLDALLSANSKETMKASKELQDGSGEISSMDPEKFGKFMAVERENGVKVRDLNKRFLARIQGSVDEATRSKLGAEWLRTAFRQVYRESLTTKQLKAALKFEDLSAEDKKKIEELLAGYEKEVAGINDRWAKEQEKADSEAKGDMGMMIMGHDDDESDLGKVKKSRRDLGKQFRDKLKGMLSDEQKARLPKPPKNSFTSPDGAEIEIMGGDGMEIPEGSDVQIFSGDDGTHSVIISR